MPHVDEITILALLLGLAACTGVPWRRGLRGRRFLTVAFLAFYGYALAAMLAAHCADIAYSTAVHARSPDGSVFAYNWRTYSLLLFGVLLMRQGAACLRAARRLARGEADARADALRGVGVVLAVVLPTVPLHGVFGTAFSVWSALTLLVVAAGAHASGRAPAAPRATDGVPGGRSVPRLTTA
jgi:hypothetical protein